MEYAVRLNDDTLYYHIPIQCFRRLLIDGKDVLHSIVHLFAYSKDSKEEYCETYNITDPATDEQHKINREKGRIIERNLTSEAYFSTSNNDFWKYVNMTRAEGLTPHVKRELFLWLCYMAVCSIGGRGEVKRCTNYQVLTRAAGFATYKDFEDNTPDMAVCKVYHLPLNSKEHLNKSKWVRYENRTKQFMRRVLAELEDRHERFYKMPAQRGFLAMTNAEDERTAYQLMAEFNLEEKTQAKQRKAERTQAKKQAQQNAKARADKKAEQQAKLREQGLEKYRAEENEARQQAQGDQWSRPQPDRYTNDDDLPY